MLGKCQATGKSQYATRRDARIALNRLAERRAGHKTECAAYNCKFCGKWHLSSMRFFPKAQGATRIPPASKWRWNGSTGED